MPMYAEDVTREVLEAAIAGSHGSKYEIARIIQRMFSERHALDQGVRRLKQSAIDRLIRKYDLEEMLESMEKQSVAESERLLIEAAHQGDMAALKFHLERRAKERWGKEQTVTVKAAPMPFQISEDEAEI